MSKLFEQNDDTKLMTEEKKGVVQVKVCEQNSRAFLQSLQSSFSRIKACSHCNQNFNEVN